MSGVWQRDERVLRWVLGEFRAHFGDFGFEYETNPPEPVPELDGMLSTDLQTSLLRLFQYGLIDGRVEGYMGDKVTWWRIRPTTSGLIALGEWPDVDRIMSAVGIRAVLDALATWAPEEEASRLREAARLVGQSGDDVVRATIAGVGARPAAQSSSGAEPVWERRDLPFLQLLARPGTIHARGHFTLSDRRLRELDVDLTFDEALQAIHALAEDEYVDGQGSLEGDRRIEYTHLFVTGRGMRALGEWPWFTDLTPKTLAPLLERLADETADEAQADEMRAAAWDIRRLGPAAVDAAVTVATAAVAPPAPGL